MARLDEKIIDRVKMAMSLLGLALANLLVYPSSWDQLFASKPEERYGEINFVAGSEIFIIARNDHELTVSLEDSSIARNVTKKGRDYEVVQPKKRQEVVPGSEALLIATRQAAASPSRIFSDGHAFVSPPLNLVTPGEESKWFFLVMFLCVGIVIVAVSADRLVASTRSQPERIFGDY